MNFFDKLQIKQDDEKHQTCFHFIEIIIFFNQFCTVNQFFYRKKSKIFMNFDEN